MRTTLVLNDELVAEAKKRAADRQTSLSAVVNDALMQALKAKPSTLRKTPFQMPTFRPTGAKTVDTSPTEMHELLASEEMEPYNS